MTRRPAYKVSGILAAVLTATALGTSAQVPSTTTPDEVTGQMRGQTPGQPTAPGTVAPSTLPAPMPQTPDAASDPAAPPMDDVGTAASSIAIMAPKEFMRQAFLANEFGIAAAQLAAEKGSTPELRETAKGILDNGLKTRSDMVVAIQGSTSDMHFDQSWTEELKQDLAELQTLEGAEFDARYVETQGELNNRSQELYQGFAGQSLAASATDESVKTFASNALPVLSADGDSLEAIAQGGQ